jgi:hypothetical protein
VVYALTVVNAVNTDVFQGDRHSGDKPATAEIDGKPVQIAPNSIYINSKKH